MSYALLGPDIGIVQLCVQEIGANEYGMWLEYLLEPILISYRETFMKRYFFFQKTPAQPLKLGNG